MSPRFRAIAVVLLLIVGVQLSLIAASPYWPPRPKPLIIVAVAGLLCLIRPIARWIERAFDQLRAPSTFVRVVMFAVLTIGSAVYLFADAKYQHRDFSPRYQDEYSYLLQTRMVAHGRLWAPPHPLGEFFESFQMVTEPVYASIYFPGAALTYAPAIWFGIPVWVMALVASGLVVGLTFLILTELIDGLWGLVAAMMLPALPVFRQQSIMAMAQMPVLLWILMAVFCWLRWRGRRNWKWAVVVGACLGWAMITRPLDGLCAAGPIAMAMLIEGRSIRALLAATAGSLPFIVLQLVFNHAVTGSAFRTPFDFYAQRSLPQTQYGFHRFDSSVRPHSQLPQKQAYYDQTALPFIRTHTPLQTARVWLTDTLPMILWRCSPQALLLILIPPGLMGLSSLHRRVMFAVLPMFVLLYYFYVFRLPHYQLTVVPVIILLIVSGAATVTNPLATMRPFLVAFVPLAVSVLAASELPEVRRTGREDAFAADELRSIDSALAAIPEPRALVLFRFAPTSNPELEPVYNIDVIDPDDAQVIRAHDLGAANVELFRYYAGKADDRAVYQFDRGAQSLRRLGTARELAGTRQ